MLISGRGIPADLRANIASPYGGVIDLPIHDVAAWISFFLESAVCSQKILNDFCVLLCRYKVKI